MFRNKINNSPANISRQTQYDSFKREGLDEMVTRRQRPNREAVKKDPMKLKWQTERQDDD